MKQNWIRKVIALVFVGVWALVGSTYALAADSSVHYEGSAQKFIFAPGSDYSPSDLFSNFKSVMPGDHLTQNITIDNDVSNQVKIKLYMRSLGSQEGSEELLSQMNLSVSTKENRLFAAPANQTQGLTDWVCLGTFYSGAKVDLTVTLDVPITLDNSFQNGVGYMDWQFKVEELPIEKTDPAPDTGESPTYVTIAATICVFSTAVILILLRKKKQKNQ